MAQNGHLIHLQPRLIFPVHTLVRDQACGRDHVGGHAVPDEENDVLRLLHLGQGPDHPIGHGRRSIVVGQRDGVFPRTVQRHPSIDFRRDIDHGWFSGRLGEQIFEPGETPLLELGCGDLEIIGHVDGAATVSRDDQLEFFIGGAAIRFGTVDGSMDLGTDIKILPRKKVGPAIEV